MRRKGSNQIKLLRGSTANDSFFSRSVYIYNYLHRHSNIELIDTKIMSKFKTFLVTKPFDIHNICTYFICCSLSLSSLFPSLFISLYHVSCAMFQSTDNNALFRLLFMLLSILSAGKSIHFVSKFIHLIVSRVVCYASIHWQERIFSSVVNVVNVLSALSYLAFYILFC